MRHTVFTFKIVVVVTMALFSLLLVADVMARGGGGGGGGGGGRGGGGGGRGGGFGGGGGHHGGHSRMGPARGGSFSARPKTPSSKTSRPNRTLRDTRRDPSKPRPDVPPEAIDKKKRDEVFNSRQGRDRDYQDEHWDRYHDRRQRRAVGTVYRGDDFSTDYCEASVTVSGVTYYECENTWYKRAYSGGDVSYIVTDAPARN